MPTLKAPSGTWSITSPTSTWIHPWSACGFDLFRVDYLHHLDQVLKRCYTTLLPWSSSYLSAHLTPAADLYGPFWVLTTLIFCLYVFSSLAHSIVSYLSDESIDYEFTLLSTAFALIYAYGLGWPALLWVALRYYGLGEWSMIEAIAVWGYGQFVWIPVSVRYLPSNLQYNALMGLCLTV